MEDNYQTRVIPVQLFKSKIRTITLCIFFILAFSFIQYLPGMNIIQETFNGLIFLFIVTIYAYHVMIRNMGISRLEVYGLLILVIVPLLVAFTTNEEFGQPYLYGILTQRKLFLIGCTMVLLYYYRKKKFTLEDVERSFLWLAWLNLALNTAAHFFVDLNQAQSQAGFIIAGTDRDVAKLTLNSSFITLGFFYYASSALRRSSKLMFCISMLFLAYIVFIAGGRAGIIAVLSTYLFFLWRWNPIPRLIGIFYKIVAVLFILGVIFAIAPSDKLVQLQKKYSEAFSVVLTGNEGFDNSSNARIWETETALPFIKKHWLLGNGTLSYQWNGGYDKVLGYFHPSDIGLLGVVYTYGTLGFLLLSFIFYFSFKYACRLPYNIGQYVNLTNSIKGFLLYAAIVSITTGLFAFSFERILLLVAILYCAINQHLESCNLNQS